MQKTPTIYKYAAGAILAIQFAIPISALANSTLEVEFLAEPASGSAPLKNVDLTAVVSGTATGPVTYKFDCKNDGSWDKIVTTNNTSYTAVDLCDYSSAGNYIAKVSVERDGLFFEGTTAIMVNGSQDLTVQLFAEPSSGTVPLRDVDLRTTVSGSTDGQITYKFDCTGDGDWERIHTTNNTSYTAANLCNYENPGDYTARVKVERGNLSFLGMTTIAVFAEGEESESTLTANKTVRNISRGETSWRTETSALPGETVAFRIVVKALGKEMNDVVIKDILPGQTIFAGNLQVNGNAHSGNIEDGINIGKLNAGEEKTITFEAQIKPAESFQFGTNTLFNTASARAADGTISTAIARITVTKTGVLGAATSVSTGVTEFLYGTLGLLLTLSVLLYLLWQVMLRSSNPFVRATTRKIYLWRAFVTKS